MTGLNRHTGKRLDGIEHLKQSIRDILSTPIGTRVGRRDYGSELFDYVDRPLNGALIADIAGACAKAIGRWEPRFLLKRVFVDKVASGQLEITLAGRTSGVELTIDGVRI